MSHWSSFPAKFRERVRATAEAMCGVGIGLFVPLAPAEAQDERPTGYPRSANERDGRPVELSAVYIGEVRGVASGGIRRDARYLDNLDLQIAIDADRLIGWQGARLFGYAIYNNGRSLSGLVGDAQGVSNIETGVRAARLFEAWVEQDIADAGSIKVGLYNVNSEFDTTQSGGLFLLSSHGIGSDIAQSGRNGPSIFPATSLAVRGEAALGKNWLLRTAVLDGVPGSFAHPAKTAVKLSARDGALAIAELEYLSGGTKAAIGAWGYTTRLDRIAPDQSPSSGRGSKGAYVFAEHRLVGARSDDAEGLAGWLRFGVADRRYNPIARYFGGGFVYTGPSNSRKEDQIGISFAASRFGAPYRASQREAGVDTSGHEVTLEAVYNAILAPWLSVQPDVQYVISPSGDRSIDDALVVGVRFKIGR